MNVEHLKWPGAVVSGYERPPERWLFTKASQWMREQNIDYKFITSIRFKFVVLLVKNERDLTLVTLKFPNLVKGAIPGDIRQLLYDIHEADGIVERMQSES